MEDDVVEIPLIPEKKSKKPQFGGNKKNGKILKLLFKLHISHSISKEQFI